MSIPKTRFRRRAQLIATWRGVAVSSAPSSVRGFLPLPRCADVMVRAAPCADQYPVIACQLIRSGGTSAARRAIRSSGSSTMCVVPSRYGVFSCFFASPRGIGLVKYAEPR